MLDPIAVALAKRGGSGTGSVPAHTHNQSDINGLSDALANIQGGEAAPHTYALDGKDLSQAYTAAQLGEKIASDDWNGINVCDYWPATLNGTYYDFGQGRFPIGHDYYSDEALTTIAGQSTTELDISFLNSTVGQITISGTKYYIPAWDCTCPILTKGAKYYSDTALTAKAGTTTRRYLCSAISKEYATVTIDGTTYYAHPADCHSSRPITLTNAKMFFEVAAINPYWRYGDNGPLTGNKPNMLMIPRDGLPNTAKMRRENRTWSWDAGEVAETLTSATAANGSQKNFIVTRDASFSRGCIVQTFVNGVEVLPSNVTLSGQNYTISLADAPATGSVVTATLISDNDLWFHTSAFFTLNDPDFGVLPLIKTALGDLASHIYEGASGRGMRYVGESRPGNGSGSSSIGWYDRGVLFFPLEPEVWGSWVYGMKDQWHFLPQLPIFAGSQRRRSKGAGNGGSRYYWWVGSPYPNAYYWCYVNSLGNANSTIAASSYVLVPGFLLT